jgi:hypothetical protein
MNTRFKVFASYNILQYLCDFIHVLIFVTVSKMLKKSQINEYSDQKDYPESTLRFAQSSDSRSQSSNFPQYLKKKHRIRAEILFQN